MTKLDFIMQEQIAGVVSGLKRCSSPVKRDREHTNPVIRPTGIPLTVLSDDSSFHSKTTGDCIRSCSFIIYELMHFSTSYSYACMYI